MCVYVFVYVCICVWLSNKIETNKSVLLKKKNRNIIKIAEKMEKIYRSEGRKKNMYCMLFVLDISSILCSLN